MQPLITILIRTSNRPQHFKRLLRSIYRQTYKNIRIVVCWDTFDQPSYIPSDVYHFTVWGLGCYYKAKKEPAFYNRYCNALMEVVDDGYFLFIDDDDYIKSANALEAITAHLKEDRINIVQMLRSGKPKPLNEEIGIVAGKCGMPNFILHAKHKNISQFSGAMDADYCFIRDVANVIGSHFIPIVLVDAGLRRFGKV